MSKISYSGKFETKKVEVTKKNIKALDELMKASDSDTTLCKGDTVSFSYSYESNITANIEALQLFMKHKDLIGFPTGFVYDLHEHLTNLCERDIPELLRNIENILKGNSR